MGNGMVGLSRNRQYDQVGNLGRQTTPSTCWVVKEDSNIGNGQIFAVPFGSG